MTNLYLTDEEVERRVNNVENPLASNNRLKNERTVTNNYGSKVQDNDARATVGAFAKITSTALAAETFGFSKVQVNSYKKGEIVPGQPVQELKDKVAEKVGRVNSRALDILMDTLDVLTPESLADLKPVAASNVARNVSSIIKNTTPESQLNIGKVIFVSPGSKTEEEYDTVDAVIAETEEEV